WASSSRPKMRMLDTSGSDQYLGHVQGAHCSLPRCTMLDIFRTILFDVAVDVLSSARTLEPSKARTAQDALLEVHVAIEEVMATARSTKTSGRFAVAKALEALAATCLVQAAALRA